MSKKNISIFNWLRRGKKKNSSIVVVDHSKYTIETSSSPALNTAERALNNLSLLVEKNRETYKRSQILLARANKMYDAEIRAGNAHAKQ